MAQCLGNVMNYKEKEYFESHKTGTLYLEEQSQPQPYSLKILIKNGFGVAFTAKYSL